MSDQQTIPEQTATAGVTAHDAPAHEVSSPAAEGLVAYASLAEDAQEWDEPLEELPPRPRRRLLGAGGNPVLVALLAVLLTACGFIGGVLVEKGQGNSAPSAGAGAAGIASRFAALRGGASGTGARSGASAAGGFPGAGAGGGRPVSGQVAYLAGSTLYVTNSEGNTVKVTTSPATSVTKTVKATAKGIHPGETVTVIGATGANGTVSAESISVGSAGSGIAALFGASGARGGSGNSGGGSGGAPALFGNGG
jgi:hypothetical protein